MTYTASTLQELLDALDGISESSEITLTDDIEITSAVEISTDTVTINLDHHTITISADNAFKVVKGLLIFTSGLVSATCEFPVIVEGADAAIEFADLSVLGTSNIAKITKKGKLYNTGAQITSSGTTGAAIVVEGYTIAAENSRYAQLSGELFAPEQNAIEVCKRGQVLLAGGTVDAGENFVVYKSDSSATAVEVTGGTFCGTLPSDTVIPEGFAVGTMNASGYYSVSAEETAESDNSSEEISSDFDTDSEEDEATPLESSSEYDKPEEDAQSEVTEEPPIVTVEIPLTQKSVRDDQHDDSNPDESVKVVETVFKSDVLYKPTPIFASPCYKFPQGLIIGAYTILGEAILDSVSGDKFLPIQYKLPGNGRIAIGYILA